MAGATQNSVSMIAACIACAMLVMIPDFGVAQNRDTKQVGPFSEENSPKTCRNGYALKGIACSGSHCDNKKLHCERYVTGSSYDRDARYRWSRWFSEEPPNADTSESEFVSGLGCSGAYCDNLQIRFLRSKRLKNTRDCTWTGLFASDSEEFCGAGRLVSGLDCKNGWCGTLRLYCCRYR